MLANATIILKLNNKWEGSCSDYVAIGKTTSLTMLELTESWQIICSF